MKMSPLVRLLRRTALVATTVASFVSVQAADYYVTPAGSGSQNGASWANAAPASSLQTFLTGILPGETVYVGSGTYTLSSLSIAGDGTAGFPKQLVGANTGTGYP